jgi:hypothetical protein
MERRNFLKSVGVNAIGMNAIGLVGPDASENSGAPALSDRKYWVNHLDQIASPVLENLANDSLRANMPVEGKTKDRPEYTHLEAFGRLLAGISPWLNLQDITNKQEESLQQKYLKLTQKALENAVNPLAKDYMNFNKGGQPLVDASFLAHGLIRAPKIWEGLSVSGKENTVNAFLSTRSIRPSFNNWLLFSAMIEAFFLKYGYDYDKMRIDFALRQHEQWFKGDGIYGDGPDFHWDYYNSYVIQPYLHDILEAITPKESVYKTMRETVIKRGVRYAAIQERLIAPDGTFPIIGRSICYRGGAFQHLANMALWNRIPELVSPEQIRCALTEVIRKTSEQKGTFDSKGWLQLGVHGHQPSLGEGYISTGSLYLCSTILLPLGLPESNSFWSGPAMDWTSKKVWSGVDIPTDHAN